MSIPGLRTQSWLPTTMELTRDPVADQLNAVAGNSNLKPIDTEWLLYQELLAGKSRGPSPDLSLVFKNPGVTGPEAPVTQNQIIKDSNPSTAPIYEIDVGTSNIKSYRVVKNPYDTRPISRVYRATGPLFHPEEATLERLVEVGTEMRDIRLEDEKRQKEENIKVVRVFALQEDYDPYFFRDALRMSGYKHFKRFSVMAKDGTSNDLAMISSEPLVNAQFHPVPFPTTEGRICAMNMGFRHQYVLATAEIHIGDHVIIVANRHVPPRFEDELGFPYKTASGSDIRLIMHARMNKRLLEVKKEVEERLKKENRPAHVILVNAGDFNCYKGQTECVPSDNLAGFYHSSDFFANNGPHAPQPVTFDGRNLQVIAQGEVGHGNIDRVDMTVPIEMVEIPVKEDTTKDHRLMKVRSTKLDSSKPPPVKPEDPNREERVAEELLAYREGQRLMESKEPDEICEWFAPDSKSEDYIGDKKFLADQTRKTDILLASIREDKTKTPELPAQEETTIAATQGAGLNTSQETTSLSPAP